jgi:hypothetical protein
MPVYTLRSMIMAVSLVVLSGCASSPDNIAATSVSTLQYENHSCRQIAAEVERVERQVNDLYYRLDKKATGDAVQMGVGLVLFWPALFFLEGGDGPEAAEYSRLKGEMQALEKVAIRKNCGMAFPEPPKAKAAPQQRNTFQQ